MTFTRTAPVVVLLLASWSAASIPAAAQDPLARVKDLYTSAAYEEALTVLNSLARTATPDEAEADQYRAFCLLALGRSDDARKVIQQIVEANPYFQPSETQVSPRLRVAFHDVRRRMLPTIVRQTYAEAKAAFDRKDLELAGNRFDTVVGLLDDADVAGSDNLSDLRTLSKGFLDLIKTAPPPAAAPPPVASPTPVQAPEPARVTFGPSDAEVTAPVAIAQAMPPWRRSKLDTHTYEGALVIVIDEAGSVTSVRVQGLLPPAYADELRRAAAAWKFQPARRNGVPVSYRKVVGVRLSPTE